MPTYDYQCDQCGATEELFKTLKQYETTSPPSCCGTQMEQFFPKAPGNDFFPEFTTNHLKGITGGPQTFRSLSEIRAFEKQHEDRKLCWEPGSYDSAHYGEE